MKNNIFTNLTALLIIWCLPHITLAGPAEDTARGDEAYNRQDVVDAIRWYEKAAKAGYAPAQAKLGYIYDKAEENNKAVHWYRLSAKQGNANGQFGLAQMYISGEGIKKDDKRAFELLNQSAKQNHIESIILLATSYERGWMSLEKDFSQAVSLYQKVAQLGDIRARGRLQRAYTKGELGLPVDPAQASYWEQQRQAVIKQKEASENEQTR